VKNKQGGKLGHIDDSRWLGSELDALIAKIGKETGQLVTVEGIACDMLVRRLRYSSICMRSAVSTYPLFY